MTDVLKFRDSCLALKRKNLVSCSSPGVGGGVGPLTSQQIIIIPPGAAAAVYDPNERSHHTKSTPIIQSINGKSILKISPRITTLTNNPELVAHSPVKILGQNIMNNRMNPLKRSISPCSSIISDDGNSSCGENDFHNSKKMENMDGAPVRKRANLDHLSPEEKLMRRKLKNRVAAQNARDKKRAKMDEMEDLIKKLQDEKKSLERENKKLKLVNSRLEEENNTLKTTTSTSTTCLTLPLSPASSLDPRSPLSCSGSSDIVQDIVVSRPSNDEPAELNKCLLPKGSFKGRGTAVNLSICLFWTCLLLIARQMTSSSKDSKSNKKQGNNNNNQSLSNRSKIIKKLPLKKRNHRRSWNPVSQIWKIS